MESTLTIKGQTTVPMQIRERIGAVAGTRLVWHAMPDGSVVVRAKARSVLDLAGSLKAPRGKRGKRVTIADMNPWR